MSKARGSSPFDLDINYAKFMDKYNIEIKYSKEMYYLVRNQHIIYKSKKYLEVLQELTNIYYRGNGEIV